MNAIYNQIGEKYSAHRKADQRIVEKICSLLDLPKNAVVADIGAGTGSYSNSIADKGNLVIAIEPSVKMLSQAAFHSNVKWIQGSAEAIPLVNEAVNGIIVILALHHFQSIEKASREFDRISSDGSVVIFTFDPRTSNGFWLMDYFPSIWEQAFLSFSPVDRAASVIAGSKWEYDIIPFALPSDLSDRFMAFGWKHPELYLDAAIRNSISAFALTDRVVVDRGIHNLRKDIDSGVWDKKYGFIRDETQFDVGYRFIKLQRKQY